MLALSGMPLVLSQLIEQLSGLPGVGPKTAMRLALNLLSKSKHDVAQLAETLASLHERMGFCSRCGCFAEHDHCMVCDNPRRDAQIICVVEQAVDVLMLERGHSFSGHYHVLHGRLNPMEGIGSKQLNLQGLDQRVSQHSVNEIILATSATVDGEATAHFLAHRYQDNAVKLSRISRGVPEGGELEYLDEYTLTRALEQRVMWE
ncbi:MAG: recombination mediator RecR [Mariprofundaceae bacterium]|nr:recombination mediator RecR [Mariprofundaceae bacterium]